ncbi:MAG: hypothetical protein WBG33_15705, partial [Rhodanobacter sp.]
GRQKSSGLQKRLRGPYFRRFLTHGTTMGRRTVENPSSRIHIFRLGSFCRPRSRGVTAQAIKFIAC